MSGGRINPFRLFTGAFVPTWLLEREELSPGAKLLYGKLCQFAGRDGHCFPRQETLAGALGIAERQVRNLVGELKNAKLIETEQPGLHRPLMYFFLRHDWMTSPGPVGLPDFGAAEMPAPNRKDFAGPDGQDISSGERQLFAGPYREEKNHEKRINGKGALRSEEAAEFVKRWNELPEPFGKIRVMSSGRLKTFGARLLEPGWNWREAINLMPSCPFLAGQNQRKWVANVEFFLRPDSVAKILEGRYSGAAEPAAEPEPFWKKHL